MRATEERKALLDGAAELQAELQKFTKRIHAIINALLGEADMLRIAAADELSSGEVVKTTHVKYGGGGVPSQVSATIPHAAGEPPKLAPGKRACGICRQPGHRRQNCPQADAKYKADRITKPIKKGKRK